MKAEDAGLPGAGRAVGGLPVEGYAHRITRRLAGNELDRVRLHGSVMLR